MPNVLGLLFGLAQMVLYFVYKSPKKNGAVSEIQVMDEKGYQLQQAAGHVAATIDADGVVVSSDVGKSVVIDITLPPEETAPPTEMRTAVEVA